MENTQSEPKTRESDPVPRFQFSVLTLLQWTVYFALASIAAKFVGILGFVIVIGVAFLLVLARGHFLIILTLTVLLTFASIRIHKARLAEIENAKYGRLYHNLTLISRTLAFYHSQNGAFPKQAISKNNFASKHSWRVCLLPQLARQDIHDIYHFDQPWNSKLNLELSTTDIYAYSSYQKARNDCAFVAVTGPGTMWPPDKTVSYRDITDGTSKTIQLVYWPESDIHWNEPRDLTAEQLIKYIQKKRAKDPDFRLLATFADGSVRHLGKEYSLEDIRAMLTIAGGEQVSIR